jgi:hypothetical protein
MRKSFKLNGNSNGVLLISSQLSFFQSIFCRGDEILFTFVRFFLQTHSGAASKIERRNPVGRSIAAVLKDSEGNFNDRSFYLFIYHS